MTCKLLYASEYIKGCNVSQWGEGCEQCVSLFHSSWIFPILVIGFCALTLWYISETPLPNKVEVMASCDHLGDKSQRPFVLSYSKTGKQDNRNCFTQAVFPTTSCYDNKKNQVYKLLHSNSSPTKQNYGRRLLGDEVKFRIYPYEVERI